MDHGFNYEKADGRGREINSVISSIIRKTI